MIHEIRISKWAQKQLRKIPLFLVQKLHAWVRDVEKRGLEEVRKIPGYHDEPLLGDRRDQRSIRLSQSYRAIYMILDDQEVEFISVEEVSKHDY